jgi:RimJ/RimL family protein N-acetyltransferase
VSNRPSVRVIERLGMQFEREVQIGALQTLIYSLTRHAN